MIETRRLALDVRYNSYPFAGQVGGDIESLTYTDSAADNSDSIDITINAQDRKWLLGWMPEKGATLRARVLGYNWERQGQRSIMECGLFVLDDVSFSDAPTTLQVGGVSKPSDSDFSELERDVIWKNTSIKRIGAKIAARYGLAFTYDADDYDIECDEQDGTDSSYYNSLCKCARLIKKQREVFGSGYRKKPQNMTRTAALRFRNTQKRSRANKNRIQPTGTPQTRNVSPGRFLFENLSFSQVKSRRK